MSAVAAVNPIAHPEKWDVVELAGGVISPGYCRWSGWKRHNQWDKKRGKGTRGSTQTLVQQPEAEGEFTFYLWDDGSLGTGHDHFAEWDAFAPLLEYDPTKTKPTAIAIYHPALDAIKISSVVIEDVGAIEPASDPPDGMYKVTVKMTEFFPVPPQQAVGTPTTSKDNPPQPNAPGTQPQSTQDVYQQQIQQLLIKAQQP